MIPHPVAEIVGRAARQPLVHATAAVASMPVASAGLNAAGLTPDLKSLDMARTLTDTNLWLCLGVVALFGALGGVVAELLSLHGNIELPHRARQDTGVKRTRLADPRYEIDLGIISRLIMGATAALALLAISVPTNPTALIVNALIAGSAGTGVFRLAQGRILGKAQKARDEARAAAAPRTAGARRLSVVPEEAATAAAN